jgi:hypothetical protein
MNLIQTGLVDYCLHSKGLNTYLISAVWDISKNNIHVHYTHMPTQKQIEFNIFF